MILQVFSFKKWILVHILIGRNFCDSLRFCNSSMITDFYNLGLFLAILDGDRMGKFAPICRYEEEAAHLQ